MVDAFGPCGTPGFRPAPGLAAAIGNVYSRDQHGKFTRIENEAVAHKLLTEGTEGKDYWIFMKDPSTAAFTDLINRAFDKPKEQERTSR